jgi:membrane associated rhomboid family serine protease
LSGQDVAFHEHGPDTPVPRITPAVQWLIAINVAVYFIQRTVLKPADVELALGFQRANLGHQWWTIATYMFVHGGLWHLALNMYTLWLFGPRVEWRWTSREFLRYYVFCGLGGWFAHLAFVPEDTLLIGASSAVLGVMLAYATLWPDEQLFVFGVIPTTVRWLVIFVGALNLVSGITASEGQGGVAYLAHVGGLAAGWLYLRTTAAINLGRFRQGVLPVPDELDDLPPRAVPKALPRSRAREREHIDDVVARSNAMLAKPATLRRVSPEQEPDQSVLDKVLDKISAHGLGSLTGAERKLLDEASKRLRDG